MKLGIVTMEATDAAEATESVDTVPVTPPGQPDLADRFENLDDPEVYAKTKQLVAAEATKNFVVEFSYHTVNIAFDLNDVEMETLLATAAPKGMVRWINIWTPMSQGLVIKAIGDHYGFTRRLQAILTMPPPVKAQKKERLQRQNTGRVSISIGSPVSGKPAGEDIELGSPSMIKPPHPTEATKDLAIYHLVKDTMGFTSVDQGEQFVCIGTNWLHSRGVEDSELMQPKHWSWLTLCGDHTVISIHDAPVFEHPDDAELRQKELSSMRSNTRSVLCQLSKLGHDEYKLNVISLKSVRDLLRPDYGRVGTMRRTASDVDVEQRSSDPQTEGASNLFYYLFEDYGGAVPVLEASKKIIADLTHRVLSSGDRRAKLKTKDIIPNLHKLRSQLRQLQNLFESYKKIIHRIARPRHIQNSNESHSGPLRLSGEVKISQLARNRFERLEDRLQMLMLNTIHECLEEQTALSQTYFNLTAQKDSQATARLTRSATLLAKLSVFFLPISFMTSYFSVEIPDLVEHYTPKTYWVSFAVIGGLSFIALFFFGRLLMFFSEMLEDWSDRLFRRGRHDND